MQRLVDVPAQVEKHAQPKRALRRRVHPHGVRQLRGGGHAREA